MGDFIQLGSESKPEKTRFRLNAFSGVVFVLVMLGFVALGYLRLGNLPSDVMGTAISRMAGSFFGAFLMSLLLAWIGFRLARRSNLVANVIFVLVMVLMGGDRAAGIWNATRDQPNREFLAAAEKLKANNSKRIDQYLDTGETSSTEAIAESVEMMKSFSKGNSPEAKVAGAVGEVISSFQPKVAKMEQCLKQIKETDIGKLDDEKTLDEYLKAHQDLRTLSADYAKQYERMPEMVMAQLKKEDLNESYLNGFLASFRSELHAKEHTAYRQTIVDYCTAAEELFGYLKEHQGEWNSDNDNGITVNANAPDGVASQYQELSANVVFLLDKMTVTEQEWFTTLRQAGASKGAQSH